MAIQHVCDECATPFTDGFEVYHRVVGHRQACSLACARKVLTAVARDAGAALAAEVEATAAWAQAQGPVVASSTPEGA